MRVLIVEDSTFLLLALKESLSAEGYVCDIAVDGAAAAQFLSIYSYDLVILDLMLPRMDGFQVLDSMRRQTTRPWTLVLSARDQVSDRVAALDAGADDFLTKPFALDELLARLRALARRPAGAQPLVLVHEELELDPRSRVARWRDADLRLSPKEFSLLELLLRRRGQVLSRTQIFERLYDSSSSSSDKAVEVIMSTLRSKLGEVGAGDPIRTRRGFGYVIE
jgi:DNA-binding response OmpR family regulator